MARTPEQVLFAHLVDRPDDEIDLEVAALLLGDWEYPGLDVERYTTALDRMAEQVNAMPRDGEEFAEVRSLNRVLFAKLGFRGNMDDYYDPRNSFLNEVIDRRTGIPISLSVVYLAVAWRLDINACGVSFPGHFLVRVDEDDDALVLDPYHMGLSLDPDELRDRLRTVEGASAELTPEHLRPASKREILTRMLANLAGIYRREGDVPRAVQVVERMLILEPDNEPLERELATLYRRAGRLN